MRFKLKILQLFSLTLILLFIISCEVTTVSLKSAGFTPLSATTYLHGSITFEASDTIGGINYHWDFGDGTSVTAGHKVTHTFENSGLHTVTLEVDGLTSSQKIKVYPGNVSYQIKNESTKELNILTNINLAGNGALNRIDLSRGGISDTLYASTQLLGNISLGFDISVFVNNVEYSLNGFDHNFDLIPNFQHSIKIITDSTKCNYRIQNGSQLGTFFYLKDL
jgi:hypothetical protein